MTIAVDLGRKATKPTNQITDIQIYMSFRQNCQCSTVATERVLADLLNQAFSVHLCEYGHRNSAKVHNPLPSSKNGIQDVNSM